MTRILVVDDEPDLVRFVRRAFEAEGYQVLTATDGAEGLRLAMTEGPDLIVLDLLMPGVDGNAVLSGVLVSHPTMRVLVLSAAADVDARVSCLERGAVDFLAKPFAIRELLARVRSRLRSPLSQPDTEAVLRVGPILLDLRARRIRVDGRDVLLSQREFLLLLHLMRNADAVCSRAELLSAVWGYDFEPATNVVDVYIGRLRAKVRKDLIQTVRNVGYQLQSA
ncbi:MAG TPA: response regulator transcription factor [Kribbella sp.]|jgi:DNA-binding response OmpR family regulator